MTPPAPAQTSLDSFTNANAESLTRYAYARMAVRNAARSYRRPVRPLVKCVTPPLSNKKHFAAITVVATGMLTEGHER